MTAHGRDWVVDTLVGGGIGLVLGGIAALNVVIFLGTDAGYEATLPELFRHQPVVAVLALALQVAGPVVGVLLARRMRDDRSRGSR